MTRRRTELIGIAIVLGCTLLVGAGAARAPGPEPAPPATAAERAEVARMIAGSERGWANETAQNFPADRWSQRDDFHGREYKMVTDLASKRRLRVEDILGAVDDDIHAPAARPSPRTLIGGARDRHADAIPCKPRPFYD